MNPLLMSILLIVGLAFFGRTMYNKILLLMALEPANRANHIKERLKNMVIIALGQKRLVGRKKERASGVMHALIFWGFCILLIRSLTLYGEGFAKGFTLPFLGDDFILGYLYIALKDIMEGIVLLMVIYAIFRRAVLKPERLHNTFEAYLVLAMIGILMISDLLLDGARYNLIMLHNNPEHLHFFNNPQYGSEFLWTPVSAGAASLISWMSADTTGYILVGMFWLHIITQLIFLNLLPLGKHFHVITALPNVFLKSLGYPHEKTKLLDLEDESVWEDESLGINHIHQLNWKQGLDLYTCTECGRCKDVCPAHITDKPLNLHEFNDKLKSELFDNADNLIKRARLATTIKEDGDAEQIEETKAQISEQMAELNSKKQLIGDVIAEDTLWACTTCRACEEVCPVTIEHVPRIMAMRQGQTLMAGVYPQELNTALKGLERNGNPWGIGYDQRADWADGLDVKIMADDADVDYLLWVGCAGSFDDRSKKVSVSLIKILQKAGVNFAILGKEEKCVIHHTQFIDQLVKTGKITLNKSSEGSLTYHDPCYLGRYNSVYDQPRSILQSISKDGLKELDRHGRESFCCGAGGGRMWMEETIGKRINLERAEEIVEQQVGNVAVGCPFCLTMLEDGMKDLGKEEEINTLDIAELVAKNMA